VFLLRQQAASSSPPILFVIAITDKDVLGAFDDKFTCVI
jgi:hypothetical protein